MTHCKWGKKWGANLDGVKEVRLGREMGDLKERSLGAGWEEMKALKMVQEWARWWEVQPWCNSLSQVVRQNLKHKARTYNCFVLLELLTLYFPDKAGIRMDQPFHNRLVSISNKKSCRHKKTLPSCSFDKSSKKKSPQL